MKKIMLFFAILTCYLGSMVYANQFNSLDLEQVIDKCAEKIVNNQIYLKPGCVFVSQKDIVLKIDESIVPLEAVYCDNEGVYVYDYQLSSLVRCNTCKRYYDPEKQRPICPHKFRWE